jgi:hypothetical protein
MPASLLSSGVRNEALTLLVKRRRWSTPGPVIAHAFWRSGLAQKLRQLRNVRCDRRASSFVSRFAIDRLARHRYARSARLAPVGRGQQLLQRSVVQSGRIALAFHRQAQHRARQLVRFHSFVADRLERQPRFVESLLY